MRLAFFLLAVSLGLSYALWETEIVDSGTPESGRGRYCSMVLSSSDVPYISYCAGSNGPIKECLMCASYQGSYWLVEEADACDYNVGRFTSIDLSSTGYPRISHYDFINNKIRYSIRTPSMWTTIVVTTGGKYSSLVLASNDYPSILAYDPSSQDLDLTYIDGGWSVYTIDTSGNVGEFSSLAIDSEDILHAAYYDRTEEAIYYAYGTGSSWNTEMIDPSVGYLGGTLGSYVDIEIDGNDNVHVVYCCNSVTEQSLYYATKDGTNWNSATVATSSIVAFPSLAVDIDNNPHITYYDNDLRYTYLAGSQWYDEVIAESGWFSSIQISSTNLPCVAYYDVNSEDLMYATRTGTDIDESSASVIRGNVVSLRATPNPFDVSTAISFTLLEGAHYSIDVFDIYGRHISSVADDTGGAGSNIIEWIPDSSVPNGFYLVKFSSANECKTTDLLLIR